ncbi:MAG: hypothetical protein HY909_00990 [Deltaproteobacteria bacterium]|nr:hypothetical protein [Deltaproteobacteria bacterium]
MKAALVALALACWTLGGTGWAQSRAARPAVDAWRARDLVTARDGFQTVLRDPQATSQEVLEAHRHLAALDQGDGRAADARGHAEAAVALDPDAVPPEGAPAETAELFTRLRGLRGGARARIGFGLPENVYAEQVTPGLLAVADVPASLGAHGAVRCVAEGREVGTRDLSQGTTQARMTVDALPLRARLRCTATLETRDGVVLDRREVSRLVVARRSRTWIPLVIGAGVVVTALAVTAIFLATAGSPEGGVELGAPRVVSP